jgi:hypothetical protein
MGLPRPISLSAAERATDRTFDDMVDTIDEVVSNLMIRMWPEEIIKDALIMTEAPRVLTGFSTANNSPSFTALVSPPFLTTDAGNGTTTLGRKIITNSYDYPYLIITSSSPAGITIENAYGGETVGLQGETGNIFQDTYLLPDDFARPVTDMSKFINNGVVSLVSPETFESRKRNRSTRYYVGAPSCATLIVDSILGKRCLCIDPIPDNIYPLKIKYYRALISMGSQLRATSPVAATALFTPIPADKQSIIIDAAIREFYAYQNQDPRFQTADMDMREKMLIMNSQDGTRGALRFVPTKSKSGRHLHSSGTSIQRLANKYDLKDYWDKN